jgi:hypothetical protein
MWEDSELSLGRFLQERLCLCRTTLWCVATSAERNIATNPVMCFVTNNDRQTHSRPILFLKKNSSDVIFAMSTMIGRMHSASR